MPSPRSKADFERVWASMQAYIRDGGNDAAGETLARRASDMVLDRAADGTFNLPPKHDFGLHGPTYIGWDFGSRDGDVTVYGEHHPDGSLTITTIEKEPKA